MTRKPRNMPRRPNNKYANTTPTPEPEMETYRDRLRTLPGEVKIQQSKPFAIPSRKNKHDPRKRNKARRDLVSKSCDVMRDSNSEITLEMNAFYPQAFCDPF